MSGAKPWIKLWTRWYESSSHALLTPEALHTGPNLLVLAGKYGRQEDGSARLVGPHGKPLSISDMAKLTRWSTAKMARILGELRQCGTLDVVANAYSFPRFDRWQESSSANRMRRHRGVTVTGDVTPECASKREDRGETRDEREPPLPVAPRTSPAREHEAVGLAAQLRERWHLRLAEIRGELTQPMDPTTDAQGYGGLVQALELHGIETVLAVTEHAVRAANVHQESEGQRGTDPAKVASMFRGQAFGARLSEYHRDQKRKRGAAMLAPHKLSWSGTERLLTDAEQRHWIVLASGGEPREVIESRLLRSWDEEHGSLDVEAMAARFEKGIGQ
jgi:hypothetical protein